MRLFAMALLVCAPLCAQPITGEIRLSVKDPSGAPMKASVRLEGDGLDRTVQTAADGVAAFTNLPPATYHLEVTRKGFAPQSLTIDVTPADPVATRTIALALVNPAFRVQVSSTPLSAGVPLNEIPAPVQTATARDLEQSGALDLTEFLNRRLNGVHINENQGNPFQPDVNYRGYTASPLLGTPQGLSVYMDGVRLNQPFGDVVSWDLFPRIAISEVTLMPGSNPLFGLNTLGGALSLQTKDGREQSGATTVRASGGSFGRRGVEADHGGSSAKGLSWYLAGNLFHDDGWRADSPSDVRQTFGKFGWQHAKTTIDLKLAYAGNTLTGNGLQEQRFLARDYTSVYTTPDITHNRSPFLSVAAHHAATSSLVFSGNFYYRFIGTDTYNGDLNTDSLDQSVYQPNASERTALAAAGYSGFPTSGANATNTPFPYWRCIAEVLLDTDPAEKCNGLINRTYTKQHNYGFSGQVTWLARHHRLTAGAATDSGIVNFQQSTQLGFLNPDHSVTPVDAFIDDNRVDLHGTTHTASVYATDTWTPARLWAITLSGRYNRTGIDNDDRLHPAGDTGSLDGHYTFHRFNPAIGVTYRAGYFSYSEGSRAPTSIELGCADPNLPCSLPNAMASDPPLKQVVTRTFEGGVRGRFWTVGLFRSQNYDDLLFVASDQTGFGYFRNFGRTRRQGVEADLNGRIRRVALGGGYTFLDATYRSPETVEGAGSTIQIVAGNRIPLVPRHMLKSWAEVEATSKLSFNLGLHATSSSFARGNENNLGPGVAPGYAVLNMAARFQWTKWLGLSAQASNLLDHHYYTAAQIGPTGFTDQGTFLATRDAPIPYSTFLAPGAPRTVVVALEIRKQSPVGSRHSGPALGK